MEGDTVDMFSVQLFQMLHEPSHHKSGFGSAILCSQTITMCQLHYCASCPYILTHMHPQECLGVSRRPDALGSWSGPLDCENQETIHTQCLQQTGKRERWEEGEERGEEKR